MTRVFHCADLHLGLLRFGQTLDDQEAMLDRIWGAAEERSAEVIVIAGDLFHSRRPAAPEILAFIRFLKHVTKTTEVLITAGNHDGPGEVEDVWRKPAGWLAEIDMPGVHAIPDARTVHIRGLNFRVLPYIHRRSRQAGQLADIILKPDVPAQKGPLVFVGHLTVAGSKLSADSVMQIGWDLTVGAETFEPYDAAMLGHIHHGQSFSNRVAYPGSPERFDFGEELQAKGGLIWDVDSSSVLTNAVDLGARVMTTILLEPPLGSDWLKKVTARSLVRIIVTGQVPAWATVAKDLRQAALEAGASWVRVEQRQVRGGRARAQLDSNAEPLGALRAWCEVAGENYEALASRAEEIVGH